MAKVNFSMTARGYDELRKALDAVVGDLTEDAAYNTIKRFCEIVKDAAVANIQNGRPEWDQFKDPEHVWPGLYRTGALLSSMRTSYLRAGMQSIGWVYSDSPIAPFHELGTTGAHAVPPRPFLWPALMDNLDQLKDIAEEEARKAMSKNKGR